MVIGNGQLAHVFGNYKLVDDICIFASGVPNSNCIDIEEFEREEKLLIKTLTNNRDNKFVYFSSCALSVHDYIKNDYYQHKENMEKLVMEKSNNYYIFRMPQLFGKLKSHKTLINFLYNSIVKNEKIIIYSNAYRYVIEISDVKYLVESYLKYSKECIVVDIANPYRYEVLSIVKVFENLLNKKANYEILERNDDYLLDFSKLKYFMKENDLKLDFSEDYLHKKLSEKLKKV